MKTSDPGVKALRSQHRATTYQHRLVSQSHEAAIYLSQNGDNNSNYFVDIL